MLSLLYVISYATIQFPVEMMVYNIGFERIHGHHHTSLTLTYQDVNEDFTLIN